MAATLKVIGIFQFNIDKSDLLTGFLIYLHVHENKWSCMGIIFGDFFFFCVHYLMYTSADLNLWII